MRTQTQNLMAALPIVASMLGDKLGVKVCHSESDTTYTDGDCIYLPSLPVDGDENLLGLVRGYISHEAGHIRFTDFAAGEAAHLTPLEKNIWNSLEDYRIEHRMAERYQGCKHDYHWLIRHIFFKDETTQRQEANDKHPAFAVLNYILLCLRQREVAELSTQVNEEAAAVDAAFPQLRSKIDDHLQDIDLCRTTTATIILAQTLAKELELYASEEDKEKSTETEEADAAPEAGNSEQEAGTTSASNCESQPQNGATEAKNGPTLLKELLSMAKEELPPSMEDSLIQAIGSSNTAISEYERLEIAEPISTTVKPLPDDLLEQCQRSCSSLQTMLQAMLQTKCLRRTTLGRRGHLSGRHMHRLAVDDPRIFLRQSEVLRPDTAVHILLDASGSMNGILPQASAACYMIASALEKIRGISVALTSFPSVTKDYSVNPIFKRCNRITTNCVPSAQGSTPLSEALLYTAKELLSCSEQRKMLFVITDGEPDNRETAKEVLESLGNMGIETYAIGIMADLTKIFKEAECINSITELGKALLRMLHKAMI